MTISIAAMYQGAVLPAGSCVDGCAVEAIDWWRRLGILVESPPPAAAEADDGPLPDRASDKAKGRGVRGKE